MLEPQFFINLFISEFDQKSFFCLFKKLFGCFLKNLKNCSYTFEVSLELVLKFFNVFSVVFFGVGDFFSFFFNLHMYREERFKISTVLFETKLFCYRVIVVVFRSLILCFCKIFEKTLNVK